MATIGRDLKVTVGEERLMGIRSATLSYNGEVIDITSGENDGVRVLLDRVAESSIDISGEGVMKDTRLRDLILNGGERMLTDALITFPVMTQGGTAATLSGNFMLATFEESAPYKEASTFSFSLQSSGDWTYTAEVVAP